MSVPAANGDFRREQTQLETSYLKGVTPQEQSGFGRDAQDWERLRRGVVGPIHKAGTFLDIGCANGLLMESVDAWSREDGPGVEVFGLDISAPLVELARRRLPHWRDRIFVGDGMTWCAPIASILSAPSWSTFRSRSAASTSSACSTN